MWRFTHKIVDKFLRNTHLQEWPDWLDERVKEQSDLIRQWYSNEPIDKVRDWEIAQQWNDSTDPTKDWMWRTYGSDKLRRRTD
jgi:hypothetical protein